MENQNSSGMMNGLPPINKSERKIGPIVGVLVIVLVLIVAALYFFGRQLNTEPANVDQDSTEQVSQTSNSAAASDTVDLENQLNAELQDVDYSF